MRESKVHPQIPTSLLAVERVVEKARAAWIRQERLHGAARGLLWGALLAAAGAVTARMAGLPARQAWWMLLLAVAGALVGTQFRKRAALEGYRAAKRIDEQLGLKDRLAGGYGLLLQARAKRLPQTPFTALLLKDAEAAAAQASREYRVLVRVPRGMAAGALCLLAVALGALWVPGASRRNEVSREQRAQVQAFNESITKMAEKIKTLEGLNDQQEKEMLDALKAVQISEEELNKMSRTAVIRRLRDADAKIKLPEGTQGGVAVRQALADKLRAIAEMEQVQQQLAQIDALNSRQAAIDLGNGQKASAVNITLESSDLQIDKSLVLAAARPGEAEQEYQKRMAAAEAREQAQHEAIKKFLAKSGTEQVPAAEAQKLAAMMANDSEFQGKVMDAIKDPSGKKLDLLREVYRRQQEQEFEKENIPRGLRQQLNTYLGPAGG